MSKNYINVSVSTGKPTRVSVSTPANQQNVDVTRDTSAYNAEISKQWATSETLVLNEDYSSKYYANKSKGYAQNAESFESATRETYNSFVTDANSYIEELTKTKEEVTEEINEAVANGKDEINSTKTTILNDIEFVADGEKKEIEDLADLIKENAEEIANRTSFAMFDTILKDHVLTYEESKGLALQGTYVYKDAIAGSRYGYADFYNKCLEEYQNSITERVYLKSNVTVVGSPTDNKGLLSGFSKTNYVTLPNHFLTAVANADTWEAEFRFTTGSSVTSPERQCIFHSGVGSSASGVGGFLADIYQGKLRISYDTNNSSGATTQITVSTYTEYFIKATFDYSTLTFSSYYKLNKNDDWTLINSLSVNGRLAESANWNATEMGNSSTDTGYYFTGSINLNDCHINIDGERWWTGVEILEYKKNSNGHLFYDIAEKEKIDELFTSTGMAWFYGVDTENERIFLPRNNWFEQAGDISEVGQSVEAGLPNITGEVIGKAGVALMQNHGGKLNGAFYTNGTTGTTCGSGAGNSIKYLGFDASLSNPIYDNSDTVQPNAVKKLLYICVGNTTNYEGMTDVVNQGMEILEQVNIGIESRVNLDATNLTQDGKNLIVSYLYTDYNQGITNTSLTFTAPARGWYYYNKFTYGNVSVTLFVNGVEVALGKPGGAAQSIELTGSVLLNKGDYVEIQGYDYDANRDSFIFFPLKGAN
jgi:gas vesicle protein